MPENKDSLVRSALRTLGLALAMFSPLVLVIGWAVYQHFFQPPNEEEFNAQVRRTAEWVLAGQTVCAEFAIVDFDQCAAEVERRAKASGQQDSPQTLKAVVAVTGASTAQDEFNKVCTEWWTQQSCAGVLADAVALVAQEKLTGLRVQAAANADEARRVQQVLQRNE